MTKKLFIGNCSYTLDETALQAFIESNGLQVSSVQIIRDRETGRSRGFGFAELSGSESVENAIQALNGKEIDGRPLTVNEARERQPKFSAANYGDSTGSRDYRGNGKRSARW
ncbi:MAG TPA: RNA-binding protein [Bdellovibrionota bacterium]|nr:RNA-binding protein [Bdellovibrionota bacterium]